MKSPIRQADRIGYMLVMVGKRGGFKPHIQECNFTLQENMLSNGFDHFLTIRLHIVYRFKH